MSTFAHIVIAGCNGRFGQVFGRKLADEAGELTGIDLEQAPLPGVRWHDYLQGSIARPDGHVLERVAVADCVVLCVPESTVLEGLEAVLDAARPDACVADIASVKSRIAARVAGLEGETGYLGLHPMFAPSDDFAGRHVALIRLRENAATARLEQVLAAWQARTCVLSADAHDRITACVQVLPHAALFAVGTALSDAGVEHAATEPLATPVHETMLALLARMLRGGSETYWSIQTDNPYAAEARAGLMTALEEIDSISSSGDDAQFGQLVERVRTHLGAAFDDLAARSERVVLAARDDDATKPD